jgi:pantetheine-phosphate adenylyltransferase
MKVAIGGTFDLLHDGHKKLLQKVFELSRDGGEIIVGVTSDTMARASRDRDVSPYDVRAENIRRYMHEEYGVDVRIVELNDRYGVTLEEDIDYVVISPETYPVALEINELREARGARIGSGWKANFVHTDRSGRDRSARGFACIQ